MASTPDTPLDDHAAATLTAMTRVLYPHDFLDDAPYRRVVAILAGEGDAGRHALLTEGVAALDGVFGRPFAALAEKNWSPGNSLPCCTFRLGTSLCQRLFRRLI